MKNLKVKKVFLCYIKLGLSRDTNYIWHGTFGTGKGSQSQSCKIWTSNSSEVNGLAADFLAKSMTDETKVDCSQSLIVLCIEMPLYLAQKYLASLYGDDNNKEADGAKANVFDLSPEEHKKLLQMYDEEWAPYVEHHNYYHFRWT